MQTNKEQGNGAKRNHCPVLFDLEEGCYGYQRVVQKYGPCE